MLFSFAMKSRLPACSFSHCVYGLVAMGYVFVGVNGYIWVMP